MDGAFCVILKIKLDHSRCTLQNDPRVQITMQWRDVDEQHRSIRKIR